MYLVIVHLKKEKIIGKVCGIICINVMGFRLILMISICFEINEETSPMFNSLNCQSRAERLDYFSIK